MDGEHVVAGFAAAPRAGALTADAVALEARKAADEATGQPGWPGQGTGPLADSACRAKAIERGAALGIDVEVVRRDPATRGFTVLPRRWIAERTFGWLMLRRLVRDYETLPARCVTSNSPSPAQLDPSASECIEVELPG